MTYPVVTLLPGKEKNAAYGHPWVFSGAIATREEGVAHGALVAVKDAGGELVGIGTYSAKSSIAVRLFAFHSAVIDEAWFAAAFRAADARRRLMGFGPGTGTDGYRVIFGEADGVPGLVVDRYADTLVIQVSTAGMEALKETFLPALQEVFAPACIIERSDLPSRQDEGLKPVSGVLAGEEPELVEFSEHGERFLADPVSGQKTGFFLDQKDLRRAVRDMAKGREVLNVFSYTGAASMAALAGGATSVVNVDSSAHALALVAKHAALRGIDPARCTTVESDAFQFLTAQKDPAYDMVIIDPPALIKSKKDAEDGKKAYHFLNRAAMRLVRDGGIFVTSSCSHFLDEEDFAFLLRRASVQNGVTLSTLAQLRQSPDHPTSVYFPESAYLKSFVFQVRRA